MCTLQLLLGQAESANYSYSSELSYVSAKLCWFSRHLSKLIVIKLFVIKFNDY